jgi:hypothetical protein
MSLKEIRTIEKNKGKKVTLFFENGIMMKSTYKFNYLGKAGENYFFYDKDSKTATIFKSDLITQIKIKE